MTSVTAAKERAEASGKLEGFGWLELKSDWPKTSFAADPELALPVNSRMRWSAGTATYRSPEVSTERLDGPAKVGRALKS